MKSTIKRYALCACLITAAWIFWIKLGTGGVTKPSIPVHFITYADAKFNASKDRLLIEAADTRWFSTIQGFDPEHLPASFAAKYEDILQQPRGGGYWIWKYPVINETLRRINDGEFIVYLDAGCSLNAQGSTRFYQYLNLLVEAEKDIMSLANGFSEHLYTTDAIFRHFHVGKGHPIRTASQYVGGVLVLRKGPHLHAWLNMIEGVLETDPWLFTDRYNAQANVTDPEFVDNRHDQSVSSVSRKIIGSVVIKDEANKPYLKQHPFWATRLRS